MTNSRTTPRMLEGIRVVDLTSVVFGPYATQILADLGADVVKVEPPTGDGFRYSAGSPGGPAMSPGYLALNRGKRSISLNLKDPADLKVMQSLLQTADVFIHNVRAKAIERLGLSYEVVKTLSRTLSMSTAWGLAPMAPMPTGKPTTT